MRTQNATSKVVKTNNLLTIFFILRCRRLDGPYRQGIGLTSIQAYYSQWENACNE